MTSTSFKSVKRIGVTPSSVKRLACSSLLTNTEICKFFKAGLSEFKSVVRTDPPLDDTTPSQYARMWDASRLVDLSLNYGVARVAFFGHA
jgi:hypothetical protein